MLQEFLEHIKVFMYVLIRFFMINVCIFMHQSVSQTTHSAVFAGKRAGQDLIFGEQGKQAS